jgi:hypothetical protein
MIVANKVSPTRGNQGALDRHAVMRDFVSCNSRRNKNVKNVATPLHADPIWNCHPGNLFIWLPHRSNRSGSVVSTAMKAHEPPNNAKSSVVGV